MEQAFSDKTSFIAFQLPTTAEGLPKSWVISVYLAVIGEFCYLFVENFRPPVSTHEDPWTKSAFLYQLSLDQILKKKTVRRAFLSILTYFEKGLQVVSGHHVIVYQCGINDWVCFLKVVCIGRFVQSNSSYMNYNLLAIVC